MTRDLDQHAVPGTERLRGRDDDNVRQRRQGLHDLVEDRRGHFGAAAAAAPTIVDGHRRQQLLQLGVRGTKERRFIGFMDIIDVFIVVVRHACEGRTELDEQQQRLDALHRRQLER